MKTKLILVIVILFSSVLALNIGYASDFGTITAGTIKGEIPGDVPTFSDADSGNVVSVYRVPVESASLWLTKWDHIDIDQLGIKRGDRVYALRITSNSKPLAVSIFFKPKDRAMALYYQDGIMNKGMSFSIQGAFAAIKSGNGQTSYYVFDDANSGKVNLGFIKEANLGP